MKRKAGPVFFLSTMMTILVLATSDAAGPGSLPAASKQAVSASSSQTSPRGDSVRTMLASPMLAERTLGREPDFTLQVPVRVSGLHPNVAKAQMSCVVIANAREYDSHSYIGHRIVNLPLTNRAYSGTVALRFGIDNVYLERHRSYTFTYKCALVLNDAASAPTVPCQGTREACPQEWLRALPWEPFSVWVEGNFPEER